MSLTPKKLLLKRISAELGLNGLGEAVAVAVEALDAVEVEAAVASPTVLTTVLTMVLTMVLITALILPLPPTVAPLTFLVSSADGAIILSFATCASSSKRTRTRNKTPMTHPTPPSTHLSTSSTPRSHMSFTSPSPAQRRRILV